jgi:nucleoside-diphosphate-sugar epimerase
MGSTGASVDIGTCLVTGGAGFIGSHLVRALLQRCDRVRVLDDLSTGLQANINNQERIVFVKGKIQDPEICLECCQDVDVVFHLAGLGSVAKSFADPVATLENNAVGSARLFSAAIACGARRVVYASSSSVYGDAPGIVRVEGIEGRPLSPYAISKRSVEWLAESFATVGRTKWVGLRFFNVYGARQRADLPQAAIIPRLLTAATLHRVVPVFGRGTQVRDYTHVKDAVTACMLAATEPIEVSSLVCNVGTGRGVSVNQLVHLVTEQLGHVSSHSSGAEPPEHLTKAHRKGACRKSHGAETISFDS